MRAFLIFQVYTVSRGRATYRYSRRCLLDSRTPPGRYSARRGHRHVTTMLALSGASLVMLHRKGEHFVTKLFQVHLQ